LEKIKKKKKAFIFGITGQDGVVLSKLLLKKKYEVYGIYKNKKKISNLIKAQILNKVIIFKINLKNYKKIINLIIKIEPHEIYNFSGVTDLNTAKNNKKKTIYENYSIIKIILNNLNEKKIKTKFFQSLSSEMFLLPKNKITVVDEKHKLFNNNNYAKSKILIYNFAKNLRKKNFFICCGFFFNHESVYRDKRFIIRKIDAHIKNYKKNSAMEIKNIYAGKDWGLADDYMEVVWRMMQKKIPDDYIIGSGNIFYIKDIIIFLLKKYKINYFWIKKNNYLFCQDNSSRVIFFTNVKKKNVTIAKANTTKVVKKLKWRNKKNFYNYLKIL
jgi:GDPmannose 4,6-dehydratase